MSNRYAQVVLGPAGSGKSTYIARMLSHFSAIGRRAAALNFDPACGDLRYDPAIDVRDAADAAGAMRERGLGPNGALVHCLESVLDDAQWLDEQIGEYEDDYLLVDMPGQIELYSHLCVLPRLLGALQRRGYRLCAVFLLDAQFVVDPAKFLSGCLVALSAMTMLEVPHVNLLSKCDLLSAAQRAQIDEYCDVNTMALSGAAVGECARLLPLTEKVCSLLDEFGLLQFVPFDPEDNECVEGVVAQLDLILQYYDNNDVVDEEYKIKDYL